MNWLDQGKYGPTVKGIGNLNYCRNPNGDKDQQLGDGWVCGCRQDASGVPGVLRLALQVRDERWAGVAVLPGRGYHVHDMRADLEPICGRRAFSRAVPRNLPGAADSQLRYVREVVQSIQQVVRVGAQRGIQASCQSGERAALDLQQLAHHARTGWSEGESSHHPRRDRYTRCGIQRWTARPFTCLWGSRCALRCSDLVAALPCTA